VQVPLGREWAGTELLVGDRGSCARSPCFGVLPWLKETVCLFYHFMPFSAMSATRENLLGDYRKAVETYGELIPHRLVADCLGVRDSKVTTWCDRATLTKIKIGDSVFVPVKEYEKLAAYLKDGSVRKRGRGHRLDFRLSLGQKKAS